MERCPLCGAKPVNTKGFYQMILTVEMLREIAKDVDVVAGSHLGRQNIKGLLIASADEIERLNKVNADMATTFADDVGKVGYGGTHHGTISGASGQPQSIPKEPEAEPPTEKEMAREMAPTLKGRRHKK